LTSKARDARSALRAALAIAFAGFIGLHALSAKQGQGAPARAAARQPARADGGFTMALTGDSLITMKLSVHTDPAFLEMIDVIRGADVAFTNLEMLLHDYEVFPSTQSGGTYMRADPSIAKELVWAGFDMVARANNHAGDYGVEGARITTKHVAEAGLVQAGVGESLREAREAKYLDTDKGRVALVSLASTFPDQSRAGVSWGDMRARPGLNPLRFTTTYVVTRQQFDDLRSAAAAAGVGGSRGGRGNGNQPVNEMTLLDRHFVVGDKQEVRTEPLKEDVDGMAAVVRNASKQADYTIVNSHTHEGGADRYQPPQFFVTFAHAMIDAGADVVTASGPHVLRGIEIYKGKPILYGLANFIFENETLLRQPPENYEPLGMTLESGAGVGDFNDRRSNNDTVGFPADERIWESVIAVPRFTGKQLTELKLYPITLGYKKPRPQRGWPMLAAPERAKKIIDDVVNFSTPYGTGIDFKGGVGVVRIGNTRSDQ
jgi:poly-gamma-glutamate capsule biosynthesis protein CapA/YwtB (metallophosphatase superfamily)